MAYHDSALADELLDFLRSAVADASEGIKQIIWRVLIVGWYKFARDA